MPSMDVVSRINFAELDNAINNTKKAVMVAAFRTGLITDADLWDELGAARNDTSHEYNQSKAMAIVALVRAKAVSAMQDLLTQLKQRG